MVARATTTPIGGRLSYDKSPGVFTIAHNYAQDQHGLATNNGQAAGQVPQWLLDEFGGFLWGNVDSATRQQTPYMMNPNGSGLMWFNQEWANESEGQRAQPTYELTPEAHQAGGKQGFKNLDAATNTIDEHIYRNVYDDGSLISESRNSTNNPWARQQTVAGAQLGSGNPFWQNFNLADVARQQTVHTTVTPRPQQQAPPPQQPRQPVKRFGQPYWNGTTFVTPEYWVDPVTGEYTGERPPTSQPGTTVESLPGPTQGTTVIPGINGVGGPFGPMQGTYGAPINVGTPYAGIQTPGVQVIPGTWGAPTPGSTAYDGGNVVNTQPPATETVTGQIMPPGYSSSPYNSQGILQAINPNAGRAPQDHEWQKIYTDLAKAKRDYWQDQQQKRAPGADLQLAMAENIYRNWSTMSPSQLDAIRFGEQGFGVLLDELNKWGVDTGSLDPAVMEYFTARAQNVPNLPQGSLAGGTGTLTNNTSLFGGNWGYMAPDSLVAMGWVPPPAPEAQPPQTPAAPRPSPFTPYTPGRIQDWNGGPTGPIGNAPTTPWAPNFYSGNDGFSINPQGGVLYGPGTLPNQSGTENTLSGMPGYNPETMWRTTDGHLPWTGPIANPFGPTNGLPLDTRAPGAPGSQFIQQPSGWIETGQQLFPSMLTPHAEATVTGGVLPAGNQGGAIGTFDPLAADTTGWTGGSAYNPLAADSSGWKAGPAPVQPQSFPSWAEAQFASGQNFPIPAPPLYQSK